jgi:isopenicillin N synthase-like dioxygenase
VEVPVIDVTPLVTARGDATTVAAAIDDACREVGFFSIVGHGVDRALRVRLDALSREFFALDESEKAEIAMTRGGRAWRGWFPVGGELTSGVPDLKEGIYFGAELGDSHPRVRAGLPLHGPNLFPRRPVELRATVLEYLDAMTHLGHCMMRGLSLALGHDADWFDRTLTADPVILFRIFHYPPGADAWGVQEHTDYGLLTMLGQDGTGGLQVQSTDGWVDVPGDADAFVCNIGDMLEQLTGGEYRSTAHRVRNSSDRSRLSFPFFFDPGWEARIGPSGTYGDYLLAKVARVFPELSSFLQ